MIPNNSDEFIEIISDFFRKNKITKEQKDERRAICDACPNKIKSLGVCKKCGCVIEAKISFSRSSCPIDSWGKI